VTLPLVLLLLDYWPLGRMEGMENSEFGIMKAAWPGQRGTGVPFGRLVREKIPLLALALVACVVTYFAEGEAVTSVARIPVPIRAGNVLLSCVIYLRQMIWPTGLAPFYPFPAKAPPLWEIGLACLLLLGISGGVTALWRKRPWLLVGWLWYLGMLAPVIGIIQLGSFAHADRNTYLAQIGLSVALTWLAADLSAGWRYRRLIQTAFSGAILAAVGLIAHTQTSYWRDSGALWDHTLACTSNNTTAHNNLGVFLAQQGEPDAAIVQYQKALAIDPGYAMAYCNLGNALSLKKENLAGAIAAFRKALALQPALVEARNNLGLALVKNGQAEEALAEYRKGLEINPDSAEIHNNLGNALASKTHLAEAIAQYRKALELNPDYAEAHYNLANSLALSNGNLEDAVAHFHKALQIRPRYAAAHNHLGVVLLSLGRVDEAVAQGRQAVEIDPEDADARANLGKALLRQGDFDGALASFQKTASQRVWFGLGNRFLQDGDCDSALACYQHDLLLHPRAADTSANLGSAFYLKGKVKEAIDAWQSALQIQPSQLNALNNLAWALATTPDASLRDGAKAAALAEQANQLSGGGDPAILHSLAAAYAEQGSYGRATVTARRAVELAVEQKNEPLAATLQQEIKLYQAGAPMRDTSPARPPLP
jgi:tetratricopeptide (TPR) repeat protein